ncbi:hypothetical protein CJD36_003745 [Flavipsychrobacter stenotrophus]|uniref:Uncharacterized protein n=1 Tax=Flavipsychrobacter stenotrophus TaxID=2077091 RepID=A0A2S7T1R0_9BACT|nr:hypothetical protein CJD36_003745 [Flavipsychrobacter stenotrophus]
MRPKVDLNKADRRILRDKLLLMKKQHDRCLDVPYLMQCPQKTIKGVAHRVYKISKYIDFLLQHIPE